MTDALLTRVAVALHGATPPDPQGALALHRDAAARVVAALGVTYSEADIEAAFDKWASPDDWGVPAFYCGSLIAALNGKYDRALTTEPTL